MLVAVGLLFGGGYFAVTKGVDGIKGLFAGAEDYPGPGTGQVLVEVQEGDSGGEIGNTLKDMGVVKSVDAFTDALASNEGAQSIQVGFYQLKKEMKASDAVDILVEPANLIRNTVTIREGLRVVDIVEILADKTDFSKKRFNKVLDSPDELGLPRVRTRQRGGLPVPGHLRVPAELHPDHDAEGDGRPLEAGGRGRRPRQGSAEALDYTPAELMTIASLVQVEARPPDMAKVARVIYNRLSEAGETDFKLPLDSTVNYAHGGNLGATTTDEERQIDSPYNTYRYQGLPPGPISAPGEEAMEAAAHPADGPWFFFVTVNLRTGETKFAETFAEHQVNVEEYREYCRNESERC